MASVVIVKTKHCNKCKRDFLIRFEEGEDDSKKCPRCHLKIHFQGENGYIRFDSD
ncbi:MAG: hypothetical protein IH956_03345 [Chloroflexi bacterium]|nr:hypothetical protein [Chloroflexota bacterium]